MSNHPSRGWRRRAAYAASGYVLRQQWRPDAAIYTLTPDELADAVRAAFLAGFERGREDAAPQRKEKP